MKLAKMVFVPVKKAIEDGFVNNIVILTVPKEFSFGKNKLMKFYKMKYKKHVDAHVQSNSQFISVTSNLLGDEGHVMFTLPVSIHQHIWAKTLVAVFWVLPRRPTVSRQLSTRPMQLLKRFTLTMPTTAMI